MIIIKDRRSLIVGECGDDIRQGEQRLVDVGGFLSAFPVQSRPRLLHVFAARQIQQIDE